MYSKEDNLSLFDEDEFEPLYGKNDKVKGRLEDRLKKTAFGGYTKASVEQYAQEVSDQSDHMKTNFEKQLRDISAECSKLSSECTVLRRQIQQAEEEKKEVMKELETVNNEKKEVMKVLEDAQTENSESEVRLEKYNDVIHQLQEQLQKANDRAEELQEELQKTNERAEELQEELKKANERAEELSERLQKANDRIEALDNEMVRLQEEEGEILISTPTEEKRVPDEKVSEISQKEAEERAQETEKKYTRLYEQYMTSLGRVEQLLAEKDAIERLLKKYQIREQELSVLREDNSELREAAAELKKTLDTMLTEMEQQSCAYQKVVEELETKKAEISRLNSQKVDLQMKNVQLLERIESAARAQAMSSKKRIFQETGLDEDISDPLSEQDSFAVGTRSHKDSIKNSAQDILDRARMITKGYSA